MQHDVVVFMGDSLLDILYFWKEFCEFSMSKVASPPSMSVSWGCYVFVVVFFGGGKGMG